MEGPLSPGARTMNTLLPFASFSSLGLLSNADLGVQIHEASELLACYSNWNNSYWVNAPPEHKAFRDTYKQWWGYEEALKDYYNFCLVLWAQRGFRSDRKKYEIDLRRSTKIPPWIGDERVHAFHRATLLKRNPGFYSRYAWKDRLDIAEIYPDMHRYGAQMRSYAVPDYKPQEAFDLDKFFKDLT